MKIIFSFFLIFMTSCSSFTNYSYRDTSINDELLKNSKVMLLKPTEIKISSVGLYGDISFNEINVLSNSIINESDSTFTNLLFHKHLKNSAQTRNLLFKYDNDEKFQRTIRRLRDIDENGATVILEDEIKILKSFSSEANIDLVIVPVIIEVKRSVSNKDRSQINVMYVTNFQYELWNIKEGKLIYSETIKNSFSENIVVEELTNIKNFINFSNDIFVTMVQHIKNGFIQ